MDTINPIPGTSSRNEDDGEPPAKRVRKKLFSDSWLELPEFAGWLRAVRDEPTKAFCICCQKKITCGRSEIHKHSRTATHIRKRVLVTIDEEAAVQPREVEAHKAAVKSAEIKLSAFYAEHNVGIQTIDHLIPVIKDIFKDSRIAQDVTLGRTKCTKIIENCLAAREQQKTVEILKSQKFSVLVDESTDITDTKTLCVLVQFVSPQTKLVVTELLELVELDARDCSAEEVYTAFKSCLESKGVPIANVVGMASDNASVMTGIHNSFMTRLRKDAPGLVVLNCICHSSALIASKACACLPRSCEELVRSIATYVSGSAKRCALLREFQELLDLESHKIIKLSDTRWLSMQKCVTRLLENWDALMNFFTYAVMKDKLKSASRISHEMNNKSRKVLIHKLAENSRLLVSQFGSNFMKPELINDLASGAIDPSDPCNFVPLEQVFLGPECDQLLRKISPANVRTIRQACLQFYVTAVTEMQKRLPLKPSFFDELRFLDPHIALDFTNRGSFRDLSAIATRFGEFDLTKLAFEWNSLPSAFNDEKKRHLLSLDVDAFWKEISQEVTLLDEKMFATLEQLTDIVLSLPHSNAEAERIFSIVTDVKTKKRNKIGQKCLNAICLVRSSFQNSGVDCRSFEADAQHLELHNSTNLYSRQEPNVE